MSPAIAILGAGPSGLTLARLLELQKIDYVVFERDSAPNHRNAFGGSLDLRPGSGLQALEEAGLLDHFKACARYDAQAMRTVDSHDGIIWDDPYTGEDFNPEIDRAQLRQILLASIPAEKVRWGYAVKDVRKQTDGKAEVEFANGETEKDFKLVVGADGIWSKVRKLITPATPEYSGVTILQSAILPNHPDYATLSAKLGKGTFHGLGANLSILCQRVSDGSYNVYIVQPLPENWAKTSDKLSDPQRYRETLATETFASWDPSLRNLIRCSEGPYYPWTLYSMPIAALKAWKTVRGVTAIGDAAHVTTPWEGEGVNVAMQDSMDLAHAIIEHGIDELDQAVVEYEKVMLPRAIDLIERCHASQPSMCGPSAPEVFKERFAAIVEERAAEGQAA